jgi:neural Wiskott-Aldrich syndrome protein
MPQVFADEFKSFPISAELGESLERAHRFAREQSHRLVTLEHLLLALTEDADATTMLASASVDLGRLSADVSGYLGGLLEDMRGQAQTELRPDADLLRVLRGATTAAQQSRRRHIDGAIVLAAIVGDAKSAAAGLLKALGLTFDGAIRALQRTHAQPGTKPAAAPTSAPASAPGPTSARAGAAASLEGGPAARSETAAPQASPEISLAASAEEFLAAARARIQQRAAAARAGEKPATAPSPAASMAAIAAERARAPSSSPVPARADLNPANLADAMREVAGEGGSAPPQTAPAAGMPEPPPAPAGEAEAPAPPMPEAPARVESTATMAPSNPIPAAAAEPPAVARLPQAAPNRAAAPLPGRPLRPGDGAVRPPLPASPPNRPPPGFGPPLRPARAPSGANGAGGPAPPQARPAGVPMPAEAGGGIVVPLQPRSAPAPASYPERGPLAESVPRRLRSGVPSTAEVRIARDKIDSLMLALCNRGVRPETYPTRTLAVRLRAPNGGFAIEANAPETQWIDRAPMGSGDGFAAWRWTITPERHGRNRLLLTVSARLIGPDGLVAETAPSDRSIEVKIAPNYRRLARLWAGWLLAMLAGVALALFGAELWASLLGLIGQASGG